MRKLAKLYNPNEIEEKLYSWWESQGYFRPEKQRELGIVNNSSPSWCITMPPPNVTGALHLGHAMTAALEDLMTRYYRMCGFETLFLPGSDHAGIATQNVVERELMKEGITRFDLGREKFEERVWEWKQIYHARITEQHKRLGISCDWSRERFTLDPKLSLAVRTAFVHLYNKGLIYRGTYMINWCPRCGTAISDLEVESEGRDGHIWYIRYPIINDDWNGPKKSWGTSQWAEGATEYICMATTRPETILGDTAIAVNPNDDRWKHFVGKKAALPATNRQIQIISDELVDLEFGTGAVKVTPGHDPTDNEIGIRHGLEVVNVMNNSAEMNENAGPYTGQDRFECRNNVVNDLQNEELLVEVKPYNYNLGACQRCSTIIEPMISTQWFVNVKNLAEKAVNAVQSGKVEIIPKREEQRFYHWMENIRPWCISRQLWWGHRIPVWYCNQCGEQFSEIDNPTACAYCGNEELEQDEDVLDTWFSSGLWPFSTLGWPELKSPDLLRFYPNDIRETGYDILFFWVVRELMLGIELTGKTPYHKVYLHGLIRNEHGKKISKSMENIKEYDPLNIINSYGCDALRYVLLTGSTPGQDVNLNPSWLEGARKFNNKIWQASRFVLLSYQNMGGPSSNLRIDFQGSNFDLVDLWIINRLNNLIDHVTQYIENNRYNEAGKMIHKFLWGEFCDWYIEASKLRIYDQSGDKATPISILFYVLETSLRLLHPFMPFITETIWQKLPMDVRSGESIMISKWPESISFSVSIDVEEKMTLVMELVRLIRNIRDEYKVDPSKQVTALISAGDSAQLLETQRSILCSMAKLDKDHLKIQKALNPLTNAAMVSVGDVVAYLPLSGLIDLDAEKERLSNQIAQIEARISQSEVLLSGDFAKKAPEHIIQTEKAKLAEMEEKIEQLMSQLGKIRDKF
jgi:valyl-tRNA synthetase